MTKITSLTRERSKAKTGALLYKKDQGPWKGVLRGDPEELFHTPDYRLAAFQTFHDSDPPIARTSHGPSQI